jgi:hypothetical protein
MTSKFRISDMRWRKARRSVGNGECVEVAEVGDSIGVRDSKDPDGPMLVYRAENWQQFLDGAKQVPDGAKQDDFESAS